MKREFVYDISLSYKAQEQFVANLYPFVLVFSNVCWVLSELEEMDLKYL